MDNEKMAQFIVKLRKANGLTQKELAGRLGVTDKAVSKWERALSCPDITLLPRLSEILGVTVSELLNGEREAEPAPKAEVLVETTIQYADTITKHRTRNVRKASAAAVSVFLLLEMIVCAICNAAVSGRMTWAWFPIASSIFAWLVVMPVLLWGRKGAAPSLVMLSASIIPYLAALEGIIGVQGLIVPMGARIAAVSLVYVWAAFLILAKTRLPRYGKLSVLLLLAVPLSVCINLIVDSYVDQPSGGMVNLICYLGGIGAAVVVFAAGYLRKKAEPKA